MQGIKKALMYIGVTLLLFGMCAMDSEPPAINYVYACCLIGISLIGLSLIIEHFWFFG